MIEINQRDRQAMNAFLQDMVRIPSYSTQEGAMAERLAAEMREVGFHDTVLKVNNEGRLTYKNGTDYPYSPIHYEKFISPHC